MIAPTRSSHQRFSLRMRNAFASLTTTQQQALYLTVVEGWPTSQVAYRLDLPCEVADRIATAARAKVYQAVA